MSEVPPFATEKSSEEQKWRTVLLWVCCPAFYSGDCLIAGKDGKHVEWVAMWGFGLFLNLLFERQSYRARSSSAGSLPKWLLRLAEANSQKLHLGLPCAWHVPKYLGHPLLLS